MIQEEAPTLPPGTEPWRNHWFPVAFLQDLASGSVVRISIHDRDYVLWRTEEFVHALLDRCPHRSARLSDGSCRNGRLECAYHGWQFDPDGSCRHIPQLASHREAPRGAHAQAVPTRIEQGMAWIWAGNTPPSAESRIPTLSELDAEDRHGVDFSVDLPYGEDQLLENILDYSHIHIVHDGVRGGGRRQLAGPLAFDVLKRGEAGFSATFGRPVGDGTNTCPGLARAQLEFCAPNLVHYRSIYEDDRLRAGLALYSLPLGRDRCRLLYRTYTNFPVWRDRIRPRFLEHAHQCHLLEQDMAVIMGQAENLRRSTVPPSALWTPLVGSDTPALEFRKWLDAYRSNRPDVIGFATRGPLADTSATPVPLEALSRRRLHTSQCSSCSRALALLDVARRWTPVLALTSLAVAVVLRNAPMWCFFFALLAPALHLLAMGAAWQCRRLTDLGPTLSRSATLANNRLRSPS